MKKKTTAYLFLTLLAGACQGSIPDNEDDMKEQPEMPADPVKRGTGSITLVSTSFEVSGKITESSSASATFSAPGAESSCTTTIEGACSITKCKLLLQIPMEAPKSPEAGMISISGGSRRVVLSPKESGSYPANSDSMRPLYGGGETLTIEASGGAVPSFNTSLMAPSAVVLKSPAAPAPGEKLQLNPAVDLPLSWVAMSDSVQAKISSSGGGNSVSATCIFPSQGGKGTIPAAVLMNLIPGGNGSLSVSSIETKMIAAGSNDVSVTALLSATGTDSLPASYAVNYNTIMKSGE